MARRVAGIDLFSPEVIAVAAVMFIAVTLVRMAGIVAPLFFVLLVGGAFFFFKHKQRQRRLEYLLRKYGDEDVVQLIMRREFWQGQTAEQLRDAIGDPLCTDKKVMATRRREVWKYRRTGRNRYALRITLDNGVVVGWDQKG